MSAIFGVWNRDGRPVQASVMEEMSARLAHRGQDRVEFIVRGPIALGHRLRRTTPESIAERQPLFDEESRYFLCCDARLDNREEIASHTELRGRSLEKISEAVLVLAACRRWRSEAFSHLLGDFAIALWDSADNTLNLVRDQLGVRSLCYHESASSVVFATEIKALLAVAGVPRKLDEIRAAHFLEMEFSDPERTFYAGIRRVPAAHNIEFTTSGVRKSRYWQLDPGRETRLASDDEYSAAFLDVFQRAVRARMRSAFPVASTLSGGLDSSGISCVARNILASSGSGVLQTVSAVFPGLPEEARQKADETEFIREVLGTGGFESQLIPVDHLAPFHDLDRQMLYCDEPPIAYNLYMHWALYAAAQSGGARVILDGFDGDASVGYGGQLFAELARADEWNTFEKEIREFVANHNLAESVPPQMAKLHADSVLEEHARSGKIGRLMRGARELSGRFGIPAWRTTAGHLRRALLTPRSPPAAGSSPSEFSLLRSDAAARLRYKRETTNDPRRRLTPAEEHVQALELPAYQITLDLADRCAAAFGLEARYPFFDRELLQFCVSLPVSQKLKNGWPRYVFRQAMRGILPDPVRLRVKKQDLSAAFVRGTRTDVGGPLNPAEGQGQGSEAFFALVDKTKLTAAMARLQASEAYTDNASAMTVHRAIVLRRWLASGGISTP